VAHDSLHDRAPAPEEAHPLGRAHERPAEERRVLRVLTIGLVAAVIATPLIAVLSYSPTMNVLAGLSPLFLTLVLGIAAIGQHYRHGILLYLLVIAHVLGLAFVWIINLGLTIPVNVPNAVALSFLIGAAIVAAALLSGNERIRLTEHVAPVEFREERLGEYVHAIEDKAKGLNFAIGRVYRRANGATDAMRERLRISREWYNEFYEIKPEDLESQKSKAKVLVHKIHDRLQLLARKEREVFSDKEIAALKNLARNRNGDDAIIDVLKTNDRDPVDHYYVSALGVCEAILKGL